MAEQINVSISQESVKAIIDAQVQAAVVQALNKDSERLIEALVRRVVEEKTQYGRSTKLQDAIDEVIEAEVRAALQRWVDGKREVIASAMDQYLKKNTKAIVAQLVQSSAESLSTKWNVKVNVEGGDRRY